MRVEINTSSEASQEEDAAEVQEETFMAIYLYPDMDDKWWVKRLFTLTHHLSSTQHDEFNTNLGSMEEAIQEVVVEEG